MKIKRFQAATMREAMRLVREEQGPDAVILSNRRIPGGVEVVAATDYDAALMHSASQRATRESAAPAEAVAVEAVAAEAPRAVQREAAPAIVEAPTPPPAAPAGAVARPAAELPLAAVAAAAIGGTDALNREIQTLRMLLEEQLAGLRWGDMQKHRPRQAAALRALVNLGLEPEIARAVAEELPESADPERARFLPLGLLSRRLPVNSEDPILEGGAIALVGPTGVGKTTSIAKLAARYAAVNGVRDIALVTADHYRVGAQEQLYTYARLLGVPVHAVGPKDSLASILARLSDRKLVLIDSAGLSQHDAAVDVQIEQLKVCGPALKKWLVIAGNAQPGAQMEVARRFGAAGLDACVLTKLDEAHRIGGALSVSIRQNLRIAYFADGQRVPEDLHVARADKLVLQATQLARQSAAAVDESLLISSFGAPGTTANVNGH